MVWELRPERLVRGFGLVWYVCVVRLVWVQRNDWRLRPEWLERNFGVVREQRTEFLEWNVSVVRSFWV
jgi:hypothetical protein